YKPRFEGQAAYIIPPIRNYHNGPTGMVYNPGTALGSKWNNHFFVAEFVGTPARAAIWAFRVKPKGATYDFLDEEKVLGGILATGLDFGPDGALYLADWIEGWETNDQGRIWKLDIPGQASSDLRTETLALIGQSFKKKNNDELLGLLQHADMRVRSKAQFALVDKGNSGAETLLRAIEQRDHQLARVHGIWGIGQLARNDMGQATSLLSLLKDEDPEIRAQAAKIIGDIRYEEAGDDLIPLLKDASSRAQFYGAEALGRIEHEAAVEPILAMLETNNDEDHYLRHAGVLALSRIGATNAVLALVDKKLPSMRTAAVLVLRRLRHPGVAQFLKDESEYIVTEAARAINDDLSIEEALPQLAAVLKEDRFTNEALLRRAISACLRVGGETELSLLTTYAGRSSAPEALRVEAISTLGGWAKPSVLDRVDGRNRGAVERDPAPAQLAVGPIIPNLMGSGSQDIQVAAIAAAGKLQIASTAPMIANLLSANKNAQVRMAALQSLQQLGYQDIGTVVQQALTDKDNNVRMMALSMIPDLGLPDEEVSQMLPSVLANGSAVEKQAAVQVLGKLSGASSENLLGGLMDQLIANKLPGEIHLDLIEVAEGTTSESLKTKLATYQSSNPETTYQGALWGGDSLKGIQVFARNQSAQCLRCHAIGPYGGEVGPKLDNIGNRFTREEILESVIDPSARITPGYGIVSLTLNGGETASGILLKESDTSLTLQVNDEEREVMKADIGERIDGPSSMPAMGDLLTMRELRDLVEFLSRIKQEPDAGDQRSDN
ncbi:MAG: HEAT repeat domain-containing protein, partial [Cyclobacteriaceae bacterium]